MVLLTAASIVVFLETDSATAVSLLLGLAVLPTVVLGPVAGAFADRYARQRVMVVADLASAAACVGGALLNHVLPIETTAFLAIAVVSALGAFFRPAAQALLPSLSSTPQLGRANSALRLATSLANIAGPAAAAFLVDHSGFAIVLWADAVSFCVSAALVGGITNIPKSATPLARGSTFRQAGAGLSYALQSHRIRTVTAAIGVIMLVGTLVNAGTLPLVKEALDLPASRYGALLAIEGAGAMGLAVLFLIVSPGRRLLVTGAFALLGMGGSTLLLGSASGFTLAAAALFAQGASVVALQVAFASYLQQEADDEFRGRVMSLVAMTASVAQLAGYALAGPLVEALGVRPAFFFAGVVISCAAVPVVHLAFHAARLPARPQP